MTRSSLPLADVLLTDQGVAEHLAVSVSTVRRRRRDGELQSVRIRNSVRTPLSEVRRILSEGVS